MQESHCLFNSRVNHIWMHGAMCIRYFGGISGKSVGVVQTVRLLEHVKAPIYLCETLPMVNHLQGTNALLPTAAGPLLTGSADGCIRCWDAAHINQSYIVCGPPQALDKSSNGGHSCSR